MSLNDPLAAVLSQLNNAIKVGKSVVVTKYNSKFIKQVLMIMKDQGYLGDVDELQTSKGNILSINLIGKMNSCGVIKPRFAFKNDQYEKFEQQHLPAKGFGILIVSTNQGLLPHNEAKEKHLGGKVISYCY